MDSTRFYENSTSGLNFDRFADHFDESTVFKVRKQYWTAKQLLRSKFGKKEDAHLLASDAEFDAKISLFRSLRDTSEQLLYCIDDYQHFISEMIQAEIELSNVLKENGSRDSTDAGKAMNAVGRVISLSAHHRSFILDPLLRFLGEIQVFIERAILDCASTVEAAEKARMQYRGSLLWMKKASNELDPDAENALENFRTAQSAVRSNKEKLDGLKLDTLQKVDLLAASRCNLISQLLENYQKYLYRFYDQTSIAFGKIYDLVSNYKNYRFEVLKDLLQPDFGLDVPKSDDEDVVNTSNVESLIDMELRECQMESIILGLQAMEVEATNERSESPLGQVLESSRKEEPVEHKEFDTVIGSLPMQHHEKSDIPIITPPPGWTVKRREKNYTYDLVELLSCNETKPNDLESFATEWSKIMEPASYDTQTLHAPSSSKTNFPSQLLDCQNLQANFPNPFKDSNFDMWSGVITEFDVDAIRNGADKSC